jgi:hypothetical protein
VARWWNCHMCGREVHEPFCSYGCRSCCGRNTVSTRVLPDPETKVEQVRQLLAMNAISLNEARDQLQDVARRSIQSSVGYVSEGTPLTPPDTADEWRSASEKFKYYQRRHESLVGSKEQIERLLTGTDAPGQIMVLSGGMEVTPVAKRIRSCGLCHNERLGGDTCDEPTCLGLSDQEWYEREMWAWWDNLYDDKTYWDGLASPPLPVEELERRMDVLSSGDVPEHGRRGGTVLR